MLTFAEARYQQAESEAKKTWESMDGLLKDMKERNQQIGEVFSRAYSIGYAGEALFLFGNLYTSVVRFRTLLGELQREKHAQSKEDRSKIPLHITALRDQLRAPGCVGSGGIWRRHRSAGCGQHDEGARGL